jgi:Mn-containing catalase
MQPIVPARVGPRVHPYRKEIVMFLRIDRLQVEMPIPKDPDPRAAAAVQELMGGRFGEMSTLMNYMFQSYNFRNREKLRPYYSLISNIATEELGHVELIAAAVNGCLYGQEPQGDMTEGKASMESLLDMPLLAQHIMFGQGAMPTDSRGEGWNGSYVFNSGNLVLDLLHNFFLECGARTAKSAQPALAPADSCARRGTTCGRPRTCRGRTP